MTVQELIEKLSCLRKDLPVYLYCRYDCGFGLTGGYVSWVGLDADGKEVILESEDW